MREPVTTQDDNLGRWADDGGPHHETEQQADENLQAGREEE